MKRWVQLCAQALRVFGSWVGSFAVWTLWLALGVLLAFQLYIASAKELALPDFVLRRLEKKLAESGLRATFSRTSFDPVGRVLMENATLSLPAYAEPVVTARAVFVQVNPLMLVVGQVDPVEVKIIGASVAIPAMLSSTGEAVEFVNDLDATLEPGEKIFTLRQLSARVAGVAVSARGTVLLPRRTTAPTVNVGELLTRNFPIVARQALRWSEHVSRFEKPEVHLELAPSESGATSIHVTVLARAARLDQPMAIRASQLRANTRLLLLEDTPTTWVEFSAGEILVGDARINRVNASLYGRLQPNGFQFDMREVAVTADAVTVAGVPVSAISAQLFPRPYPNFDVVGSANLFDAPIGIRGRTNPITGSAAVSFRGDLSPKILDEVSRRRRTDVRRYFDFTTLVIDQAEVRLAEKWRFENLLAHVRVQGINAYGVRMTDGVATVELDPHRFHSPEAFARIGDNYARGSYEQNLDTLEYRFLLAGRLRPLEISEWFREWWPNFFQQLEFPSTPPDASVDVRGFWQEGYKTSVFVHADARQPIIRGAHFERMRTRLFIRPGFFDGLEIVGLRPEGQLRGRFAYVADDETDKWRTVDLAFDSTLDLAVASQIAGPALTSVLEPFQLSGPPTLNLLGRFTGPSAPEGEHQQLRIKADTRGEFRYHHFPLQHVSFLATLTDGDVTLEKIEALFAGGVVGGRARLTGSDEQRRLGFDVQLRDASLGEAAAALQGFLAHQKGQSAPPPGKFVQEKANVRVDFAASAEGQYNDPLSFRGAGNATLQGAEIGEVALFGPLSELLRFTTLRFNNAQANIRIDGARLVFPEVKLTGANAAIDAHGTYALDRRELDFNAKIYPFQESENLIKSVVGAVLTPLSNAFEVKLTGSLDKPQWSLLLGPTNFLRSLGPGEAAGKEPAGSEPANAKSSTPATPSAASDAAAAPAPKTGKQAPP